MQPVALSRFLTVAFFPRFDAGNEGFYIFFRLLVLSGNFLLVTDIEQWRPVVRHLHRKGGIQLHPSCRQHPLVAGDRQTPLAINDKKVALSGAGGAAGTAKCREKLTELLTLPFIGYGCLGNYQQTCSFEITPSSIKPEIGFAWY